MSEIEVKNRFWVMKTLPDGNDFESALEMREENKIEIPEGCFATKNSFLSMDAGTRMYMTEREDSYQPPIPTGEKLMGTVLGEVIESNHPEYKAGEVLRSYGQWSDYSVVDPNAMYPSKVDISNIDLVNYVGIYGANGWTAYVGVMEVGKPKPGENFLVSAAAGATGSLAGQIAKKAGCRVIGLAGSNEKCDWLTNDLGFDVAINYKQDNLDEALKKHCPEGIDIYFDNVAGDILDTVMQNLALNARIPLCGLLAQYNKEGARLPGPDNFDQLLMKRATITGFFCPDFLEDGPRIESLLAEWYKEGSLKFKADITNGLENVLVSYKKIFTGENVGKTLVKL